MKAKSSPTERIDRRYLLIKAESKKEIEEILSHYLGALGMSKASIMFPEIAGLKQGEIVMAIKRKELDNVRAAFEISSLSPEIKRVSGTIKGLGM
jgi:RNase P/RNase MRP subunit POP5